MSRPFSFAIAAAVMLTQAYAWGSEAAARGLSLTWQAPPGCPRVEEVEADVLRLVGGSATVTRPQRARAVVVSTQQGRWLLLLQAEVDGTVGERALEGDSCEAVAKAAAVTLALMLNPDAESAAPGTPAPSSSTVAEPAGPEFTLLGGAQLGLGVGTLPSLEPQVSMGLGAALGRVSWWLSAGHGLVQRATTQQEPSLGGRVWFWAARTAGCWDIAPGVYGVEPCLNLDFNHLAGRGRGVALPQKGTISWLALGASLRGYVALSELVQLQSSLTALAPLKRPRVFLEDVGEVHRPGEVALRWEAGFAVTLW